MNDKFEKIRNHKFFIFDYVLRIIGIIFVIVISFLDDIISDIIKEGFGGIDAKGGAMAALIALTVIVITVAISVFIGYLQWRYYYISADDENLTIEKGIFLKKKQIVPFEKINTVDAHRNILHQVAKVCRLKIDTGAVGARSSSIPEVMIVLDDATAERLRNFILAHSSEAEEALAQAGVERVNLGIETVEKKAKFSDFILFGATRSLFAGFIVLVAIVFPMIGMFFEDDYILDVVKGFLLDNFGVKDVFLFTLFVALVIIAVILVCYVVSTFMFVITSAIRFYDFTAVRRGDNINIKYGLFTKKSYTLPVRNIHAVIMQQNLLRQITGHCSVEVVSIGYGDEKNEVSLLFPIVKKKKLGAFLQDILPEYATEDERYRAPARSLALFILPQLLFWTIIAAAVLVFTGSFAIVGGCYLIIALITVISGLLSYAHAGISYGKKLVCTSAGGFNRKLTRIRQDCVQSVGANNDIIMRMFKVSSYRIDYHAPVMKSIVVVPNLTNDHLEKIAQLIED
ncbi:MAG: PH domain-containing protein [Clostridia bacterium]|nr:PH domain-containing protein [Clostridia bacterium]